MLNIHVVWQVHSPRKEPGHFKVAAVCSFAPLFETLTAEIS